jgi:hypothetical protein
MKKSTGTLENWTLKYSMAKEMYYLSGDIYNDKKDRFPDGQRIYTSRIEEVNFQDGYAKTKNSIYKLGACSI